ncbi:hypothetical protein HK100_009252 [Physocladia obscura]|uniref:pyridoxal 5'-phosphate synthase n=1 Tax=Physocladia obscura TaxID=109957 RepID=A0AAD5T476_9FUNG|nr:hypothetical protein HK100_009252 [Physocladia obscura]
MNADTNNKKTETVAVDLSNMRATYTAQTLDDINDAALLNPLALFATWLDEAKQDVHEANAMTLSTVGPDGKPSSRVVLLKAFDDHGFVLYTNYNSRKSAHLAANGHAALTFYWKERQVRIEGHATRTSTQESDAYFATRPRASQIGAWVSSAQSSPVGSRAALLEIEQELEHKFAQTEKIPRPEFWGGWRVSCDYIEFWQGRVGRLHDRLVFTPSGPDAGSEKSLSGWTVTRLMP